MGKKKFTLEPLNDRILLERVAPDSVSPGGIVLPEKAKETTNRAIVVSVPDAHQKLVPGDEVMFSPYGGTDIKVEGKDYLLISFSDIIARVR